MDHTLTKWSHLGFASHWVALATYIFYVLIQTKRYSTYYVGIKCVNSFSHRVPDYFCAYFCVTSVALSVLRPSISAVFVITVHQVFSSSTDEQHSEGLQDENFAILRPTRSADQNDQPACGCTMQLIYLDVRKGFTELFFFHI